MVTLCESTTFSTLGLQSIIAVSFQQNLREFFSPGANCEHSAVSPPAEVGAGNTLLGALWQPEAPDASCRGSKLHTPGMQLKH